MVIQHWLTRHPLLAFFALVYLLTWGAVALIASVLSGPGATGQTTQVALVALPMLLAPGLTGLGLTAAIEGRAGLRALLARMGHWRVAGRWYAAALAVMPLLVVAILLALAWRVAPAYAPTLSLMGLSGLVAGYLEEWGWTGFATPRLLAGRAALRAGLVLGLLWGVWHAAADYAIRGQTLGAFWPVTFGLFVLPLTAWRMCMVWVYARTQSGPLAQLLHFAYTGSLSLFIPLAALTPAQDALIYAVLAVVLWAGVAALALRPAMPQPAGAAQPKARLLEP